MGAVLSLLHTKMDSSTTSSHNLQDQVDLDVEYETFSYDSCVMRAENFLTQSFPSRW